MRTLLVEIGVEELPARWIGPTRRQLGDLVSGLLDEAGIDRGEARTFGTPRRLAVLVDQVSDRQPDREQIVRGPAARAAFGPDGEPTRAAEGFARGQGVTVGELFGDRTEAGEYVFARVNRVGQPTVTVLAEGLGSVIDRLEFPVTMRWGDGVFGFGRPIRWLVAMYGDQVVPVEVAALGIRAGADTYGHRTVGTISLAGAEVYRERLRDGLVIADEDERRDLVRAEVERAAFAAGARALIEPALLDEVTGLVEWPTAVVGEFPDHCLDLPAELLVTVLGAHQRYFPLREQGAADGSDPDGRSGREYGLRAGFCCVINGGFAHQRQVIAGHERVIRARLDDARFFYDHDLERPLADRVPDLDRVTFFVGAGTIGDRCRRSERTAESIARELGLSPGEVSAAARAARLSKADLTTQVVSELPELAGAMGRIYARASGETELAATAIYEHVLPRNPGDRVPGTTAGAAVALADRLDAMSGFAAAGVRATGSQDPYGLRRLAAGVVAICDQRSLPIAVERLVQLTLESFGGELPGGVDAGEVSGLCLDLVRARARGLLEERGARHDVVDAVLAPGIGDIPRLVARAEALMSLLELPELHDAITVYRRTGHLAGDAGGPIDPSLFTEPTERELHRAVLARTSAADDKLRQGDYLSYLLELSRLRPEVDRFFLDVLVMCEDPELRTCRLNLLREIAGRFGVVGDLRRLAIDRPRREDGDA